MFSILHKFSSGVNRRISTRIGIFALAISIFGSASPASARNRDLYGTSHILSSAKAREAWNSRFGSDQFYQDVSEPGEFLKTDARCQSDVRKISSLVAEYGEKTDSASSAGIADGAFQKVVSHLKGMGASNPCLRSALQAYYLTSFHLLQSADIRRNNDRPQPEDPRYFKSQVLPNEWLGGHLTDSIGPVLLSTYLANKGNLKVVAQPATCGKKKAVPKASAAYRCGDSSIHLFVPNDLNHLPRPYDAGAQLSHEQDHLLRDKTSSLAAIRKHFSSEKSPDGIDWNSYNLLDESLAIILTATQARQAAFPILKMNGNLRGKKILAPGDLSVIRNEGNFHDLAGTSKNYYVSATEALLPKGASKKWLEEQFSEKREEYLTGILSSVAEVYYALDNLTVKFDCNALLNVPAPQELSQDSLFSDFYWYGQSGLGSSSDRKILPVPGFSIPMYHTGLELDDHKGLRKNRGWFGSSPEKINVGPFLDSLLDFETSLAAPSETCVAYEKAVSQGGTEGYLGDEVGHDMDECGGEDLANPATKISGDGVKPVIPATKISGDGVKPVIPATKISGDGVKPVIPATKISGDGVKPSAPATP